METCGRSSEAQTIQALHEKYISAVLLNSQLGEFVKTTGSLSPILFNFFPEKIMQETLHDHHTSISICGRAYVTYDLPTKSILWAASMLKFKTSPTDSKTEQRHMEWKSAQKRARS